MTSSVTITPQHRVPSWKITHLDLLDPAKKLPCENTTMAWGSLPASAKSQRTRNPIREIVDPIVANLQQKSGRQGDGEGNKKDHISLSIGDPTAFGNLPPCPVAIAETTKALQSAPHAAGYVNACGLPTAREAIAAHHSTHYQTVPSDQVVVASGCSGALELALTALLDEGSVLLVPNPGFPLYEVIAESHGAEVAPYRLDPDNGWEVDLRHLTELVTKYGDRCRGIVVCNPSNPTGSVFSRQHLKSILKAAEAFRLPIVADEVYGDLTFGKHRYHPMSDVAAELGNQVPVITASGIGKQYLLPGWRVGWAIFHDNVHGSLAEVEAGTKRLAQVVLGASHLPQTAVPALLDKDNKEIQEWKSKVRMALEHQATHIVDKLSGIGGLEVSQPEGAMYVMVRIDPSSFDSSIDGDVSFSKMLLDEENVFALPGSCFKTKNAFRAVICAPPDVLGEAADRIREFCNRHYVATSVNSCTSGLVTKAKAEAENKIAIINPKRKQQQKLLSRHSIVATAA